jgi:outer membrane lipoprotein-sorting protein
MMRSLYCIGIVVALMVSGCSVQGEAATSMAQNRSVNTVVQATSESASKAEQNINSKKKLIPTVVGVLSYLS